MMCDPLEEVDQLSCKDEDLIIESFIKKYDVTYEAASDIFNETKKWLWLASVSAEKGIELFIDKPLMIIDMMWHVFILHTKLYQAFCLEHFGKYIHHTPTSNREEEKKRIAYEQDPEQAAKDLQQLLEIQYGFIYDKLGGDTLEKWYATFAKKYTPDHIRSLQKE